MIPLARRSPVSPDACNLACAIDLIGDRWTLLVLRSAMYGVRRFDDFQAELGCPRTVLSGRLKALTDAGLIRKRTYQEPGKRSRPEYVLTEMGASLRPALVALTQWGDRWLSATDIPPISFVAGDTKSPVRTGFIDESGREVPSGELRPVLRR